MKGCEMTEPIRTSRSNLFSKVYSTNVLVSETDSDVRIYGFNEIINTEEGEIAICDGELILTDQATLILFEQMKNLMERWKTSGKSVEISENRRNVLDRLLDGF
jgi:hypothetical protein